MRKGSSALLATCIIKCFDRGKHEREGERDKLCCSIGHGDRLDQICMSKLLVNDVFFGVTRTSAYSNSLGPPVCSCAPGTGLRAQASLGLYWI